MRADDVIMIDDDDDTVHIDMLALPLTIKVEAENIPVGSEQELDEPRRSHCNRKQRVLFSPTVKGKYHKAVGFLQTKGNVGGGAPLISDGILTNDTEEFNFMRTDEYGDPGKYRYQGT